MTKIDCIFLWKKKFKQKKKNFKAQKYYEK